MTFAVRRSLALAPLALSTLLAGPVSGQEHAAHPQDPPDKMRQGHMHRRFDDADEWAKSFDDPARDAWQMPDRVIGALGLRPGQTVADIGAGTGYFTVRLAKSAAAPKVIAVDIEPSMVEYARRRAEREGLDNVSVVLATAEAARLPGPVDVILLVNTYHHVPERIGYFTRLRSSLTPGGRLAVIDWRKGAPMGPPEEHRFTPAEVASELAAAGFVVDTGFDFLPHQHFQVFRPAGPGGPGRR